MIATSLVEAGATVYIGSRSEEAAVEAAAALSAAGHCRPLPGVVTDADSCRAMAAAVAAGHRRLDILVNNAALSRPAPFGETPPETWDEVFAVNVKAPFLMTQAFLPLLTAEATADDPARLVNMGSISGLIVDGVPQYAYSSSKAALHHLTRSLALELAPRHVLVNAIALGPFQSDTMESTIATYRHVAKPLKAPLRRIGRPAEVGGTVVFLCGPSSTYITGAVIPVDGGIATTS
jgi:NAD(P)-dependent dehydrogenase (short-subunit alcohol dehydrogenase family)